VNKIYVLIVTTVLFLGFSLGDSYALQQIAGLLEININPGETKSVEWGLISDYPDRVITVHLRAEGQGSEFLSFPTSMEIPPNTMVSIKVTAAIPENYVGEPSLKPILYAIERGEEGGPTIINIQMKKFLSLNISVKEKSELKIDTTPTQETPKQETITPEPMTEPEPVCSPGTVLKDGVCVVEEQQRGGGCLIATATYGSELAPQVQQLREIRDNSLLQTESGRSFMESFNQFYYSFSPEIADLEHENPVFKKAVKLTITPLLSTLSLLNYVDMDSEAEVLGYGISLILLNVGMYFVLPIFVIHRVRKFV